MMRPEDTSELTVTSGPKPARWLRRLAGLLAIASVGGSIFLLAGFFLFAAKIDQSEHPPARRAEAMIALTGGKDRIADALELLAKGYAHRLLISGVNPGITRSEIAQLTPKFRTLVECCVDLGYEARNTIGNAYEARRWFADNRLHGPLVVVTSNYHMQRAMAELGAVLPGVELIAAPVVTEKLRHSAWWQDLHVARIWASEYAKFVVSLARLTLRELGPSRTTQLASR